MTIVDRNAMTPMQRRHDEEIDEMMRQQKEEMKAKHVKWEYSAPDIPDSHWIERGHERHYVERMKRFLGDLKDITCLMRRQKVGLSKYAENYDRVFPTVIHDGLLIPHWKELTDAIQLYEGFDGSRDLSIWNVELRRSVFDMLATSLTGKLFEGLTLHGNDFESSPDGINFAIQMIQSNPCLKKFRWVYEHQCGRRCTAPTQEHR